MVLRQASLQVSIVSFSRQTTVGARVIVVVACSCILLVAKQKKFINSDHLGHSMTTVIVEGKSLEDHTGRENSLQHVYTGAAGRQLKWSTN